MRAHPPCFSRYLLHIHQFQHRIIWLGLFGDVPSHLTLVGICFNFISFSIAVFSLGYLETCPPTPTYVGTYYFINNQHHGYGSIAQNYFHRSPFARLHTISNTVGHKHYRYLYPWIFICHGFGSSTNPHFIEVHFLGHTLLISQLVTSITGYLYPRIFVHHSYGLNTQNSSLQQLFIFNKGFSGGNFTQWGPLLLKEGGMIRMENGINPWYSSTHVIYPPMEFTHGIVMVSTHGIYSPMVL